MKNAKITIRTNAAAIACGAILLGLIIAVAFSYREMSTLRRDLYAVRADFYGLNQFTAPPDGGYVDDGKGQTDSTEANFEILSQNVSDMRINDDEATALQPAEEWVQQYKTVKIRTVEVKITNDTDWTYSYYDSLGYTDANGVIKRTVAVHPDENKNTINKNYSLELAPGGTATIFLYFLDDGMEINKLYNSDSMNGL